MYGGFMPRQVADYAGARGNISITDALRLSSDRYAIQIKKDGAYCAVRLDHAGRVAQITSRTGADFGRVADSFRGIQLGLPGSVYVGEIEGHTERGRGDAERRGFAKVHLFDILRHGDVDVSSQAYRTRRDLLYRAHSELALPENRDEWCYRRSAYRTRRGRFSRYPLDWTRFEVVPQVAPARCSEWWDMAIADEIEGLVVVDLNAPLGRARAKRKLKPVDTIDGRVVEVKKSSVRVQTFGGVLSVSKGRHELCVGSVVSIAYSGRYASGEPKFCRIERVRTDIMAA